MKNRILIVAAVLALGCLAMVVFSSQAMSKNRQELDQERYKRIETEEKLEQTLSRIKMLEAELTNSQNQTQSLKTVLEQEQVANTRLKTELNKMTQLKGVLEEQLKDALVSPVQPSAGQ